MTNTLMTGQPTFKQLIEKDNENRHSLELLRFFSAHPNARFNRLAVIQAQNENEREFEVERALVHLINEGIVKVTIENSAKLYALTEDESKRRWVLEMIKLEWHHWQLAFKKATFQQNEAVSARMV